MKRMRVRKGEDESQNQNLKLITSSLVLLVVDTVVASVVFSIYSLSMFFSIIFIYLCSEFH